MKERRRGPDQNMAKLMKREEPADVMGQNELTENVSGFFLYIK